MVTQIRESVNGMRRMVGLPEDETLGQDLLKVDRKGKEPGTGKSEDSDDGETF